MSRKRVTVESTARLYGRDSGFGGSSWFSARRPTELRPSPPKRHAAERWAGFTSLQAALACVQGSKPGTVERDFDCGEALRSPRPARKPAWRSTALRFGEAPHLTARVGAGVVPAHPPRISTSGQRRWEERRRPGRRAKTPVPARRVGVRDQAAARRTFSSRPVTVQRRERCWNVRERRARGVSTSKSVRGPLITG